MKFAAIWLALVVMVLVLNGCEVLDPDWQARENALTTTTQPTSPPPPQQWRW